MWLTAEGSILREDTVELPNVEYAYIDGDTCRIATVVIDPFQRSETHTLHALGEDGTEGSSLRLFVYLYVGSEDHGGHAYEYSNGILTLVTSAVVADRNPLEYTVRMVRYTNGMVTESDPWPVDSIPENAYLQHWALARGPSGSEIVGYHIVQESPHELRFHYLDEDGIPSGVTRTYVMPSYLQITGLSVREEDETVYPFFTCRSRDSLQIGGVFLAAFPVGEIRAARETRTLLPSEIRLEAFPNPFNASVRIAYDLPAPGVVRLTIHDVLGRRVAELHRDFAASPHGEFLWNAEGASSGIYFVRMACGEASAIQKLLLLR